MSKMNREEFEALLARRSPGYWAQAQNNVGRENYYYDRSCRFGLVTIDIHAGTTPMFIKCMGRKGMCSGVMSSMGYPAPGAKPAWLGEATHGWYRPDEIDPDKEDEETDHLLGGGLLLRELTEADRATS